MTTRIVRVIAAKDSRKKLEAKIKDADIIDTWEVMDASNDNIIFYIILSLENSQAFLDSIQSYLDKSVISKVIVSSIEALLPAEKSDDPTTTESGDNKNGQKAPRDELYDQLSNECTLNLDFILFTLLSTIVAAVGLLESKTIAIIAAMVIAPMFEPNVGLALGVALSDKALIYKAFLTNISGVLTCLGLSIIIGFFWPYAIQSEAILQATQAGYSNVILALAAGAAGVLSLTSRTSSVLVGVMVAVALLPPLVACGILFGSGAFAMALGSAILFLINIVCISLTANIVFILKQIHPHKWYEKQRAKKALVWYSSLWLIALIALCLIIYYYYK